ncbi:MAG: hypothetical protein OXC97_04940, partial [Candidatus Dadabacteria bacterium]|nr:hypothetical protein [Candidatus Dadabacteria bacterium]
MSKLYNRFALRHFQGVRGLRIFAFSMAFCLTGLLAFSSCDDDNDAMAPEPMEMSGFFISADEKGATVCSNEDVDVYLEGDESTGKLDVTIVSAGE